ncbi:hypothetical protein [Aliiglaciecola lipolytica]|uniref:Uncharacterized protein n=1 Tax=Aliiglaciecola lipolytica E3 TaxID=1127673 RepID=K6Y848_9ALTE|nr:hypothetical protein [Aliiglaciecola lipolytica]GAC12803.1 hypothetical protein GLIP_0148 [Aliiglaciecola lipolytica E3]
MKRKSISCLSVFILLLTLLASCSTKKGVNQVSIDSSLGRSFSHCEQTFLTLNSSGLALDNAHIVWSIESDSENIDARINGTGQEASFAAMPGSYTISAEVADSELSTSIQVIVEMGDCLGQPFTYNRNATETEVQSLIQRDDSGNLILALSIDYLTVPDMYEQQVDEFQKRLLKAISSGFTIQKIGQQKPIETRIVIGRYNLFGQQLPWVSQWEFSLLPIDELEDGAYIVNLDLAPAIAENLLPEAHSTGLFDTPITETIYLGKSYIATNTFTRCALDDDGVNRCVFGISLSNEMPNFEYNNAMNFITMVFSGNPQQCTPITSPHRNAMSSIMLQCDMPSWGTTVEMRISQNIITDLSGSFSNRFVFNHNFATFNNIGTSVKPVWTNY